MGWNDGIMVWVGWWRGLGVAMLRTRALEVSLGEAVLPPDPTLPVDHRRAVVQVGLGRDTAGRDPVAQRGF